ncbi:uncharacterized protein AAGF69_008510 isoform 2-T2 [Amazona ochrocephala]
MLSIPVCFCSALLLRLSACDRPERGQGKSRQDCWDAFHLLPAYQKLHQPTVTRGPKGVQMEGKGRLPQRRAMGTAPVCGHERAGQQQCQHHPVCRANSARCQTERVLSSEDPSEDDEETCTGPCRRALHGSGWWWSPWVFRDEQQTVKRQRTSLERRPKERPRARLPMGRRVCRWRARAACLRGRLRELHLCVATNELGNSNASIILYAEPTQQSAKWHEL